MCTQRSNRKAAARRPRNSVALSLLLLAPLAAHALSTDRQQNMLINADYSKIVSC